MIVKGWLVIVVVFTLSACAGVTQPIKFPGTNIVTKEVYAQTDKTNGVVLLDINWGRWWGCGGHENAQLISLAFDSSPRDCSKMRRNHLSL